MEEKKSIKSHTLSLNDRSRGMITGVLDVDDFDGEKMQLQTEAGKMLIKGENLHIQCLDLEKGEMGLEGRIDSITYLTRDSGRKEESLLKRMFR